MEVSGVISHVVHLEGCVGNIEIAGEKFFEGAAAGMAVFVGAYEDVGGEGGEA